MKAEHADPVGAVEQGDVELDHVARRTFHDRVGLERDAGHRVVDGLLLAHHEARAEQGHEVHLVVVLQQHRDVAGADLAELLGDQGRNQLRGHRVRSVQEGPEEPLAETFGPIPV